ncbi:MAG: hypothetical protein HQK96_13280 [Nitrospirae bacterium]|nr:hypothetical protein [Nitrospirota bacterium]
MSKIFRKALTFLYRRYGELEATKTSEPSLPDTKTEVHIYPESAEANLRRLKMARMMREDPLAYRKLVDSLMKDLEYDYSDFPKPGQLISDSTAEANLRRLDYARKIRGDYSKHQPK